MNFSYVVKKKTTYSKDGTVATSTQLNCGEVEASNIQEATSKVLKQIQQLKEDVHIDILQILVEQTELIQ